MIRTIERRGSRVIVIDIVYKRADGTEGRYRRDAQSKTMTGARAEERRLLTVLGRTGELDGPRLRAEREKKEATFGDATQLFRELTLVGMKPSTRRSYIDILDTILLDKIGKERLVDIDKRRLAELDAELLREKPNGSTSRRRNVMIVLRSVFKSALTHGLIEDAPRFPPLPKIGKKVPHVISDEHMDAIMAEAAPHIGLAFAISVFAGLRPQEVRGLEWGDVDLVKGEIVIHRAISDNVISTTKSGHERPIPISGKLHAILTEVRGKLGEPKKTDRVCLNRDGEAWGQSGLRQAFERVLTRLKLDGYRHYDTRHFFVTSLLRRGAPSIVVQDLAGHADLSTTERYAHVVAGDRKAAIARLDGQGAL